MATMRDSLGLNEGSFVPTRSWIASAKEMAADADEEFLSVFTGQNFGKVMRLSDPARSLIDLEETEDHLPQGSLWVQKGSEVSRTLKTVLFVPPDVEE